MTLFEVRYRVRNINCWAASELGGRSGGAAMVDRRFARLEDAEQAIDELLERHGTAATKAKRRRDYKIVALHDVARRCVDR